MSRSRLRSKSEFNQIDSFFEIIFIMKIYGRESKTTSGVEKKKGKEKY